MIARLKKTSGPRNAVIAKGRKEGKLQMLLSLRKNGLTSLFKEVRVFKVLRSKFRSLGTTPISGKTLSE